MRPKPSPKERLSRLRRELFSTRENAGTPDKGMRRSRVTVSVESGGRPRPRPHSSGRRAGVLDARFADYLATSFHSGRPLRHERRLLRNKILLLSVVFLLLLFWAINRFFL